jgi:hypothetical protein
MADKKKGAKASPKDMKKTTSHSELRDLDMLDSKIDKVKGGAGKRTIRQKRGRD